MSAWRGRDRASGAQAPPLAAAAVSRQVYASKYFDASLGLTLLLQGDAGERATYVVYINRSRIDALDGWFGAVKRTMVRSRTRSGMKPTKSGTKRWRIVRVTDVWS